MRCAHCEKALSLCDGPEAVMSWCNDACIAAWDREHPEEAAEWIRVDDLNSLQRAELDAMLGHGKKC